MFSKISNLLSGLSVSFFKGLHFISNCITSAFSNLVEFFGGDMSHLASEVAPKKTVVMGTGDPSIRDMINKPLQIDNGNLLSTPSIFDNQNHVLNDGISPFNILTTPLNLGGNRVFEDNQVLEDNFDSMPMISFNNAIDFFHMEEEALLCF